MPTGTVKWFDSHRGYGFIRPDEGGADLFVHYTGIAGDGFRSLEAGDRVTYDVRPGRKGTEAHEVRPSGEAVRKTGGPRERVRIPPRPFGLRKGRASTKSRPGG